MAQKKQFYLVKKIELPSNSGSSSRSSVSEESGNVSKSTTESKKSPYIQKIEPKLKTEMKPKTEIKPKTEAKPKTETKPSTQAESPPKIETPEEKRARAREIYCELEDLKKKHGITLTRNYTSFDDPDEMQAEYIMQKEKRNKYIQVKFYKQILLGIVSGVEFLNTKYDPFDIKLNDWSKQIAMDQDDYTEVLEELYEKYKDRGGKMAPEIRLLFMIIMSAVTYHLSQTLFGPNGVTSMVKSNPNMLNDILKSFTNGKNAEPIAAAPATNAAIPSKTNDILNRIREANGNKKNHSNHDISTVTESTVHHPHQLETTENQQNITEKTTEVGPPPRDGPINNKIKQERDALIEKNRQYEIQLRKQDEMFRAQLEQTRNQQTHENKQQQTNSFTPITRVLSMGKNNQTENIKSPTKEYSDELYDLIDTLDGSATSEVSDIISSSALKKKSNNTGMTRTLTNKGQNTKGQDSLSDNLSTISRNRKKLIL
jgi:hypothetical protein